jgi:hypothetical protein
MRDINFVIVNSLIQSTVAAMFVDSLSLRPVFGLCKMIFAGNVVSPLFCSIRAHPVNRDNIIVYYFVYSLMDDKGSFSQNSQDLEILKSELSKTKKQSLK